MIQALDQWIGPSLEMGRFLEIAVGAVEALEELHARGIVHREVRPSAFCVEPGADGLNRVRIQAPGLTMRTFGGAYAYMSPEQTGRMSQGVDRRSDLYSLGVSFYELLTGQLPFEASDATEWVHHHFAREPRSVTSRRADVPRAISGIVTKLLSKSVEGRYQTARGLLEDLRKCRMQWEQNARIEAFELGRADVPDRPETPTGLYGRDAELGRLADVWSRTQAHGVSSVVLVAGGAGVGKTALISRFSQQVAQSGGYFASAKSDQYRRGIPYSAILPAFEGLVDRLLTQSESEISAWRMRLKKSLGMHARVLVKQLPRLEWILGEVGAEPPALPSTEAKNRLHMTFGRLLAAFCEAGLSVVLFLDDLHWADEASLELLEFLVADRHAPGTLFVGAYRDPEMSAERIDRLRTLGAAVELLEIAPLGSRDMSAMIRGALGASDEDASGLAKVLLERTGGNPFFAIQFLDKLVSDRLIVFERATTAWRWDLEQIAACSSTDNIVDFLIAKLAALAPGPKDLICTMACAGQRSTQEMLRLLIERDASAIDRDLWVLNGEGLIRSEREGGFEFAHDRIQQAAYQLVPVEQRQQLHLRIGRLLLTRSFESELFDAANHWLVAEPLIVLPAERATVAVVALRAGKRAKDTAAYHSALEYLELGLRMLEGATDVAELSFALSFERGECLWLAGRFADCKAALLDLLPRCPTRLSQLGLYRIKAQLHTNQGEMIQAVESALEALRLVGVDWPLHPTPAQAEEAYQEVRRALGGRQVASLADLPSMQDAEVREAMAVVSAFADASLFFADPPLTCLMACFMVSSSLRLGNCSDSPMGYALFAMVSARGFARYADVDPFGQLALTLISRPEFIASRAKVYDTVGMLSNVWVKPYRSGVGYFDLGLDAGVESGDLLWASFCVCSKVALLWVAGEAPLSLIQEAEHALAFSRKVKFDEVTDMLLAFQRFAERMRGQESRESDAEFEHRLRTQRSPLAGCWYYLSKLQAAVIFGQSDGAAAASKRCRELLFSHHWFLSVPEFAFYDAMAQVDGVGPEVLASLVRCEGQLAACALSCPANFGAKHALVAAEIARIRGDDAAVLYERALRLAREGALIHCEALAFERYAQFNRERGRGELGDACMRQALACYERWGASAKVRQILAECPRLGDDWAKGEIKAGSLDALSVVKASQAISGEIDLERLILRLSALALEQGGAQRGWLLLDRGDDLVAEVLAELEGDQVRTIRLASTRVDELAASLPLSVIQYVRRTGEAVVLPSARDAVFGADPYYAHARPPSVLCVPIVRGGGTVGLFYLENQALPNAFTRERVTLLEVLASQAAISLENALLISGERVARIAAEVAAEEARKAVQQREDFMSIAAHELRTPLTPLKMQLGLLRSVLSGELGDVTTRLPELGRLIQSSDKQIQDLKRLVDDMLDVSRLRTGRLTLVKERMDLHTLLTEVLARYAPELKAAGCATALTSQPGAVGQWDRLRIEQVVINLLTNAMRYGAGKPIHCTLESSGDGVRFVVQDSGCGIAEADLERIFGCFERAASVKSFGGFGLGLYISRQIVEGHGGTIRAHSRLGEGATFEMRLPLAESALEKA